MLKKDRFHQMGVPLALLIICSLQNIYMYVHFYFIDKKCLFIFTYFHNWFPYIHCGRHTDSSTRFRNKFLHCDMGCYFCMESHLWWVIFLIIILFINIVFLIWTSWSHSSLVKCFRQFSGNIIRWPKKLNVEQIIIFLKVIPDLFPFAYCPCLLTKDTHSIKVKIFITGYFGYLHSRPVNWPVT